MSSDVLQDGFAPVKVLAETKYKRAFKGGTGDSKVGGNYAPGLLPQQLSSKKGYSQVLWLGEGDAVTEIGAMNLFVFWTTPQGKKQLITAPLDGTICSEILPPSHILSILHFPTICTSCRRSLLLRHTTYS